MNWNASLALLQDPKDIERSHRHSVNHYGVYAAEILEHAGMKFATVERSSLTDRNLPGILLLPYRVRLSAAEAAALEQFVRAGGTLIACGGIEGADALFGLKTRRRHLDEARLNWPDGGLGLSGGFLPVWGGQLARRDAADGANPGDVQPVDESVPADGQTVFGELIAPDGERGVAVSIRRLGAGAACFIACDIPRSVVEMQQGVPVLGDAAGAPDGSAPLDDRILKSDDGAVIDWALREEGPEGPAFLTPFADRLRELLVAVIVHATELTGNVLAASWYWPHGTPAVAALSYDTDSNEDPHGRQFLEVVRNVGVQGTWCVMYPGGYERATYDAIRDYGDEIALHFDGLTSDLRDVPHCGWSQDDFDHQLAWLKEETGVNDIISQKNHVTRWEGWLELFRWVEESGIRVDQTKGPSKIGNLGFNFGTCHPWRPMEDTLNGNRLMDVLELNFHTHDMHHSQRRVELRRKLIDVARSHAGVAHFIFHPQRIVEPGQPEAIRDVVEYARSLGVEWWTSERIWRWEMARRAADVRVERNGSGELQIHVTNAPDGFTVDLYGLGDRSFDSDGQKAEKVEVFGQTALRLILEAGDSLVKLTPVA